MALTPKSFDQVTVPIPECCPAPPDSNKRPSIIIGRDDRKVADCCKSLLVAGKAGSEAFQLQNEKFGVYR